MYSMRSTNQWSGQKTEVHIALSNCLLGTVCICFIFGGVFSSETEKVDAGVTEQQCVLFPKTAINMH